MLSSPEQFVGSCSGGKAGPWVGPRRGGPARPRAAEPSRGRPATFDTFSRLRFLFFCFCFAPLFFASSSSTYPRGGPRRAGRQPRSRLTPIPQGKRGWPACRPPGPAVPPQTNCSNRAGGPSRYRRVNTRQFVAGLPSFVGPLLHQEEGHTEGTCRASSPEYQLRRGRSGAGGAGGAPRVRQGERPSPSDHLARRRAAALLRIAQQCKQREPIHREVRFQSR